MLAMWLMILYDCGMSKGRPSEIPPELREALKDNPHVIAITKYTIRWSQKILEAFCREYDKGTPSSEVLKSLGIDPDLLGKRVGAFHAYYGRNFKQSSNVIFKRTPSEVGKRATEKLSKIEQEVAYLNQEVDFLKKILIVENPGLEKQNPQKNTR